MSHVKVPFLTEEKFKVYKEAEGIKCPVCGSDNINAEEFEYISETSGEIFVECHNCGSTWSDVYQLTAVVNLEVRTNNER